MGCRKRDRQKFAVFYELLSCCSQERLSQSAISRRVNIDGAQFKRLSAELLKNELLSVTTDHPTQKLFHTTKKGFEFMKKYCELQAILKAPVA